jgi:Tfp pilus assembly protein PilF
MRLSVQAILSGRRLIVGLVTLFSPCNLAVAQAACASPAGRQAIERGWAAYRANDIPTAVMEFRHALAVCPRDVGALTGAGYAAMRQNLVPAARSYFARALAADSTSYDAASGAGMAAYRAGDLTGSRKAFERVLRRAPQDSTALWYLARLPGGRAETVLSLRARPSATTMVARTGRRFFETSDGKGGWLPMWIKAVNLGAALPGKFPSEFPPNDGTYERWIATVGDMGANAIRVYTIHPPHFYAALRSWNLAHPTRPIWLIHGVWTEPPPGKKEERYEDTAWLAQFRDEMRRVVTLVHGDALIAPAPGHASGTYTADVSPWTLAYIIGREWEPYSVVAYNGLHRTRTSFAGQYILITNANPLEAWLADQCNYLVSFEMERYNAQRPIAYTNWPTLDPLTHPTETGKTQEISLLRKRGEKIVEMPKEYDNDAVGLDAVKLRPTAAFPAGVFASYHAYPYYPEFMVVDPGYLRARSPEGPSNYFGYLRELVAHHGDMPVVISEYGVPSARGSAHFQPQGWNHGGLSEDQQAAADARLTRDIYAAGAAGAGLFSLIDEWFKKNWVVTEFEYPPDRKRLWLNPLDAEENYGIIAMRAGAKGSGITIDGDTSDWRGIRPLYSGAASAIPAPLQLKSLRVAHDEAYVYLRIDVGSIDWSRAHYQLGIDTYRRDLGDTRLPNTGSHSPVGLEFVLDLSGPSSTQVLVDHPYNLYRGVPIPGSKPAATQYVLNDPFRTVANDAGVWDSLVVVTNRRRISRDGRIFEAIAYNRNRLLYARQPDNSLADWYANPRSGMIEVRLPWAMLNMTDPSSRSVLFGNVTTRKVDAAVTDGFRFVVESYDPSHRALGETLPRNAGAAKAADLPTWTWPTWEDPTWHAEVKPLFIAMQKAFASIPDHPAAR